VLVPFSNQAFLVGELQPHIDDGKELVQIVVGADKNNTPCDDPVTISTTEAKEWFVQHSSRSSSIKASILKSTDDVEPPQSTKTSTTPTTNSPSTTTRIPEPSIIAPGFVEIQEEYNADGTQVRGNVVDVSKQLSAIWDNADEPSLSSSVPAATDGNDNINIDDHDFEPTIQEPPLKPVSDTDYDQLSKRLDELARLEESGASVMTTLKPKRSTTKPGSGWKKGFLTSKSKKAKPPVKPSSSNSSNKGVSFDTTQNKVQEIPRIGTQRVPPKPGSSSTNTSTTPSTSTRSSTSKPLESSIFSGVIHERPVMPERPVVPETPEQVGERPTIVQERKPTINRPQPPKKRLSRFAQERQGGLQ
jgi:hypothetical protein